ncbi:MAG: hypothetical protein AB7W37_10815 [Syntrophobacteraceae bacterium]
MEKSDARNLPLGIITGVLAAVIGAVIWALVTVTINYQIGWMALGVGFLVAYAMRLFGGGSNPSFGAIGAVIALMGCIGGNILTIVLLVANHENIGVMTVLARLSPQVVMGILRETFQPMDFLFYAIAMYEAYKFSMTRSAPALEPAPQME